MQVTISHLPVSLSLVHVPRSRLSALSHPILRQILHPNPAFLNITCNEIELSIFAEHHMLQDFEPIARKDRQRQRSRSGSGSGKKASLKAQTTPFEPVEISYEKWGVLQIDSHSDQVDQSGSRVCDVSAPLAAAGISILYQSSYMSDFIFVKESRMQEALKLFADAGFHLYTADSSVCPSPSLSPVSDDVVSDLPHPGTVLTSDSIESILRAVPSEAPEKGQQSPRHPSPSSSEVGILQPDLACVGLSDDYGVDHWGLKIVKLVAFPDLISLPRESSTLSNHSFPPPPARPNLRTAVFLETRGANLNSTNSDSSSSDDDGYFSHSPQNLSTTSLTSNTSSRSYSDIQSLTLDKPIHSTPSKHFVSTLTPLSPITPSTEAAPLIPLGAPLTSLSLLTHSAQTKAETRVPFFSFTRTPEGSSLTADVHILATLFPPQERHMVICSGELDAADCRVHRGFNDSVDQEDPGGQYPKSSFLKCLQIDLRRFGLDKHGLVNRFSKVLQDNGINHMYSSTFKTANLLVDKEDSTRAQSLLRAC